MGCPHSEYSAYLRENESDERTRTADLPITSWRALVLPRAAPSLRVAYPSRNRDPPDEALPTACRPVPARLRYALRLSFHAGTDRYLSGAPDNLVHQGLPDALLDQEPGARVAVLAGVGVDALHDLARGAVQLAVGEDDLGGLAAELEDDGLYVLRGRPDDGPPRLDGPGEGDRTYPRVLAQGLAGLGAEARDDVVGARGEAEGFEPLGEQEGRQGRLLGGFDHRGVSRRERRGQAPTDHAQWRVPRNDVGGNPQGLANRVVQVVGTQRDGLAVDLVRNAGVVVKVADAAGDLTPCVPERLARVQCLQPGEFLLARLQRAGHPVEQPSPVLRRYAPPDAERRLSRPHGIVDVLRRTARDGGDDLLRRGVHHLERPARAARRPPTADEEFVTEFGGHFALPVSVCTARRRDRPGRRARPAMRNAELSRVVSPRVTRPATYPPSRPSRELAGSGPFGGAGPAAHPHGLLLVARRDPVPADHFVYDDVLVAVQGLLELVAHPAAAVGRVGDAFLHSLDDLDVLQVHQVPEAHQLVELSLRVGVVHRLRVGEDDRTFDGTVRADGVRHDDEGVVRQDADGGVWGEPGGAAGLGAFSPQRAYRRHPVPAP